MVFVTNQEISRAQRAELHGAVGVEVDVYHLERVVAVLDRPDMLSVRRQYLAMEALKGSSAAEPLCSVASIGRETAESLPLVGRDVELEMIRSMLQGNSTRPVDGTLVIEGMAGVGKTAVAIEAATAAVRSGKFTGGAVEIDFDGFAAGRTRELLAEDVLPALLHTFDLLMEDANASTHLSTWHKFLNNASIGGGRC